MTPTSFDFASITGAIGSPDGADLVRQRHEARFREANAGARGRVAALFGQLGDEVARFERELQVVGGRLAGEEEYDVAYSGRSNGEFHPGAENSGKASAAVQQETDDNPNSSEHTATHGYQILKPTPFDRIWFIILIFFSLLCLTSEVFNLFQYLTDINARNRVPAGRAALFSLTLIAFSLGFKVILDVVTDKQMRNRVAYLAFSALGVSAYTVWLFQISLFVENPFQTEITYGRNSNILELLSPERVRFVWLFMSGIIGPAVMAAVLWHWAQMIQAKYRMKIVTKNPVFAKYKKRQKELQSLLEAPLEKLAGIKGFESDFSDKMAAYTSGASSMLELLKKHSNN